MIPKVNLDDRTFQEIKEEAIALIPRYCPEWTNHNDSDPGITLIELFAWMTEMTMYRLNKVPAKTYLAMLELMGLDLTPAQSARAVVEFHIMDGCQKDVDVMQNTKIASVMAEKEPVIFETEKKIKVRSTRIISCANRIGESWKENCVAENKVNPFTLFDTENDVQHILYIKSSAFAYLKDGHGIQISFVSDMEISSSEDEITKHLAFEYWDGKQWLPMESFSCINGAKVSDNVIYLKGLYELSPLKLNGTEGLFIRAVLTDIPNNLSSINLKSLILRNIFVGDGFIPELCVSCKSKIYEVIEQNNTFRLFGEVPVMNDTFYIASDEVFKNKGTKATIKFLFSEMNIEEAINDNAVFVYEYWNGHDWKKLSKDENSLIDETFSFKQSGNVSFVIPEDMSETDVDNETHIYIRIRLLPKDFSFGGKYEKNIYGETEWQFDEKVQSPVIEKLRISYEPKSVMPENVFAYTNFHWLDESSYFFTADNSVSKPIFLVENETLPSLYIGFSRNISAGEFPIYFRIDESVYTTEFQQGSSNFIGLSLTEKQKRGINLEWEFWNENQWEKLDFCDETDFFHNSGFVNLKIPVCIKSTEMFGKSASWIRCVMRNGSFEQPPLIEGIVINCVNAINAETHKNEIIGSGNGAPGQRLQLAHENLLSGMELRIREDSVLPSKEIEMMRLDGIDNPVLIADDEVWIKYKEVPNFYNSTPFSRHYTVDYSTGEIQFGDGIRGICPPKGSFNIKVIEYKTGGGREGNVAAHKLQYLTRSIPYITGCDNPYPAEGGCDMEDVDGLKKRAAGVFKSLDRAVSKEDFEWLSMKASGAVGRAYCLNDRQKDGSIRTLIIPKMPQGYSLTKELKPSRELMRRVSQYLDGRKLVGTKISVGAPVYRHFSLLLVVEFKGNVFNLDMEKQNIEHNLTVYFHPLLGGEGSGWKFGKSVTSGMILKQLDKISSILSIKEIRIKDVDAGISVETVTVADGELPFLTNIEIVERE